MGITRFVNRMLDRYGSESLYLRAQFLRRKKQWLNLRDPKTFNQKIQWLKLYYRRPLMRQLANKYEVREYVESRVGESVLTKLIAVYDSPDEIRWDALPNQFAMKVAHGSALNILCRDKDKLDRRDAVEKLRRWCATDSPSFEHLKEWAYGESRKCIIVEELMIAEDGQFPCDYKFFCFNGEPRFVQVDCGRFTDHRRDLFDLDWQRMPFEFHYPNSQQPIAAPPRLDDMVDIARALSSGFPFVRIDLYALGQRIIFGEVTFYPEGGLGWFKPERYDRIIGEMLKLPPRGSDQAEP